jgi:hypothetical protein
LQCVLAARIFTVDFVVCTLAVKKKSGQVSTCRIGPLPFQSIRLRIGTSENDKENLGYKKCKTFLEKLSDYQLLKEDNIMKRISYFISTGFPAINKVFIFRI